MYKNILKNWWWVILPVVYLAVMVFYSNFIFESQTMYINDSLEGPRVNHQSYNPVGVYPGSEILIIWFSDTPMKPWGSQPISEYSYMINALILVVIFGFVNLLYKIYKRK